jgi:sorting nexin-1/2
LGQSEADDLGKALTKMGTAADELSSVSMVHSEREMMQFEEPLKDYLKTIHAVKLALQRRHEKRLTYTTCLAEVNTKRTNLAKFRATPGAEAKAYGAEMSLKRGESAADAARDAFATVSQRVLREVDRFKREKGDEMRRVVLDYITLQIEYNKKMEQVWAELLPKLESIQAPGDNGTSASSGGGDGTYDNGGEIPNNVVTGESEEVQDLSQQEQHQQHQTTNVYQPNMNMSVGHSMLGLGDSVQYRDNTNVISGM